MTLGKAAPSLKAIPERDPAVSSQQPTLPLTTKQGLSPEGSEQCPGYPHGPWIAFPVAQVTLTGNSLLPNT